MEIEQIKNTRYKEIKNTSKNLKTTITIVKLLSIIIYNFILMKTYEPIWIVFKYTTISTTQKIYILIRTIYIMLTFFHIVSSVGKNIIISNRNIPVVNDNWERFIKWGTGNTDNIELYIGWYRRSLTIIFVSYTDVIMLCFLKRITVMFPSQKTICYYQTVFSIVNSNFFIKA